MFKISAEKIKEIEALSAAEAIRRLLDGTFSIGESDFLIETILAKANVNCNEEEMWDILYEAMGNQEITLDTVLGRLAQ